MPSGLGSIDDYQRQDSSEMRRASVSPAFASPGFASPGFASPAAIMGMPSNGPSDRNGNRAALVNDVVLGALVIGLFALQANAAHQRRHR